MVTGYGIVRGGEKKREGGERKERGLSPVKYSDRALGCGEGGVEYEAYDEGDLGVRIQAQKVLDSSQGYYMDLGQLCMDLVQLLSLEPLTHLGTFLGCPSLGEQHALSAVHIVELEQGESFAQRAEKVQSLVPGLQPASLQLRQIADDI